MIRISVYEGMPSSITDTPQTIAGNCGTFKYDTQAIIGLGQGSVESCPMPSSDNGGHEVAHELGLIRAVNDQVNAK